MGSKQWSGWDLKSSPCRGAPSTNGNGVFWDDSFLIRGGRGPASGGQMGKLS